MRWMNAYVRGPLLVVTLCTGAVLALAPANAQAADTDFRVAVRVLPSRPAPDAIATLPVPADARALGTHRQGKGYHFAGTREDAMRFYRERMPALGYRLLAEHAAGGLLWERQGTRIDMRFQQVLGEPVATRILIDAAHAPDAG